MSLDRITQKGMHHRVLGNLQGNLQRLQRTQEQLSSGRTILRASDSPTGAVGALHSRAELRRFDQMLRNADDATSWLGTADNVLVQALDSTRRVRELALAGGNAATGSAAREAIAAELDVLREGLLMLANTRHLGRPVFNGTSDGTLAFDPTTGAYLGDAGRVTRAVGPGAEVQVNLPGTQPFGDPADGDDLFAVIANLAANLRNGDTAAVVGSDLDAIDRSLARLTDSVAAVGARYHHVETMRTRTEDAKVRLTSSLSEIEGVDLAAAIMELQLQQVAYEAALGASARAIQPSLMDFLR